MLLAADLQTSTDKRFQFLQAPTDGSCRLLMDELQFSRVGELKTIMPLFSIPGTATLVPY